MEQNELSPGIKSPEYELHIRQIPTQELVAFDFGIIVKKDMIQVYIDDHLKEVIDTLLRGNESVILKVNFFSQDVLFVVSPVSA